MTIEIGWWGIPLLIVIVGWLISNWYFGKNYSPGGYFGDMFTPMVSAAIFILSLILAIGILIGKWIGG